MIRILAWAFSVAYLYRRAMREPDAEIGKGDSHALFVSIKFVKRIRDGSRMIHIGSLIRQKLQEQGRTVTWFAFVLHCDRTNVYKIFQKSSIDSSLLYRISCVLNYDFFAEYTYLLKNSVDKNTTNL